MIMHWVLYNFGVFVSDVQLAEGIKRIAEYLSSQRQERHRTPSLPHSRSSPSAVCLLSSPSFSYIVLTYLYECITIQMPPYEDSSLLSGFRYRAMQPSPEYVSGTSNRLANKLLLASEFRPWSEFDAWAQQCSYDVSEAVVRQGCTPNNHQNGNCQGTFRNWAKCQFGICRFTAEAKLQLQQPNNLASDAVFRHTHCVVLQNLKNVAKKLRHHWRGDVKEKPKVAGYDEIRPSLAVFQPGVSHPYFTMSIVYPNQFDLLPRVNGGSHSLAAAYNEIAGKKPTNGQMKFAQNCLAQAIQDALFTGTGYGCLFNHNQAVFLKVSPDCTERRNESQTKHRVYISREFRCGSEGISIFHGIVAIMLKGHEHERHRTFLDLQKYYRILKKSEYARDRKELRFQRDSPRSGPSG